MHSTIKCIAIGLAVAILFLALLVLVSNIEAAEVECHQEPCPAPNTIHDVCWSVTAYWPFKLVDAQGEEFGFRRAGREEVLEVIQAGGEWVPVPWNYQADATPTITGDGFEIDPYEHNWGLVAGPIQTYGHTYSFPWGDIVQHDTFGIETYQNGVFYHDGYGEEVIGVDILTWENVHYLECDGVIK